MAESIEIIEGNENQRNANKASNRTQTTLFPACLDDAISPENEVRLIDAFVNSLDIAAMGFRVDHGENGRPAYHPKDLLKLFIYGYLNRIRSSRQLEKENKRNIEVFWLLNSPSPDHNTISNFRRDNGKAIVEHPYGTIKRQWGFSYIMTKKTIVRAEADVGFIMTADNLRRLISIIGIQPLISMFRALLSLFSTQNWHYMAIFNFIANLKAKIKSFVIFSSYSEKPYFY